MSESVLRRLARCHGIDVDATAAEAIPAALAALGVDVSGPAAAEAALAAWQAARESERLPTVQVWHEGDTPWRLPVWLARGAASTRPLRWRLTEETGALHEGVLTPASLMPMTATDAGRMPGAAWWHWPTRLPVGYHRLVLEPDAAAPSECTLAVAPSRAYWPDALDADARVFGVTADWPTLRSLRQWGVGDASDLSRLVEQWGRQGASVVGVGDWSSSLPDGRVSHRGAFDALLIDLEAVPEWTECESVRQLAASHPTQDALATLRASPTIDRAALASLRWPLIEGLWAHFRRAHLAAGTPRGRAFAAYVASRGPEARRLALFDTLQFHLERTSPRGGSSRGWLDWSVEFQDPDGPAVGAFAAAHAEAVDARLYGQWLAAEQVAGVGHRSWARRLGIGVMADFGLEVARGGAQSWLQRSWFAHGFGLATDGPWPAAAAWRPGALRAACCGPVVDMLRTVMEPAGALRWHGSDSTGRRRWVADADPSRSVWVEWPSDDLLGIALIESRRQRCMLLVAGEAAVGEARRERLAARGLLFEEDLQRIARTEGGLDRAAGRRGPIALSASPAAGPSFATWWDGADLPPPGGAAAEERERRVVERAQDRARLLLSLERAGLLPAGATVNPVSVPVVTPAFHAAVQAWLARGPAPLLLVRLLDLLWEPGAPTDTTVRLGEPLERLEFDDRFLELVRRLAAERAPWPARARAPARRSAVIPRATYRVQLNSGFTFADAAEQVPYWSALGISHLYCSPILRARPGSTHGYDVVDHGALHPDLGSESDFRRLVDALRAHGMGIVLDIVPNHMGVHGADNAWWLDVLESGPASAYAEYFDIDWRAADPALTGRVLLPLLGDQYGVVLERGELTLAFDAAAGRFTLHYFGHLLPVDPSGYGRLIRRAAQSLPAAEAPAEALAAALGLAEDFDRLPERATTDAAERLRRQRDTRLLKARLAHFVREQPALGHAIDSLVRAVNGVPGPRAADDPLDAIIGAQAYRLAYWRVAGDEINYRRFFDINDLAALRMERPEVFEATHRLVLQWLADGTVDGLRIDHSDGLADPAAYFARLQRRYAEVAGDRPDAVEAAPRHRPVYVVTEKITAPHEEMPRDWAVHGTTGYRFANLLNGLLIDPEARTRLDRTWRAFTGSEAADFENLAWEGRHLVMEGALAGELTVLATALLRLAREDRRTRDFTLNTLRRALAAVVAAFPAYRTYVVQQPSVQDRRFISWAVGVARRRSRAADASVFDFLRRVLLGRPLPRAPAGLAHRYRAFTHRFQQYTAPVTAKGIEDTALYRHHRLISVNDVGGDPEVLGRSVASFHAASRDRAQHWPYTMLATTTHDSKRSEDVRARIDVISEMPPAWRLTVRRWSRLNRRHKRSVDGRPAPTASDEYFLYQTLVGSFPATSPSEEGLADYAARIEATMVKGARESKAATSWISPNEAYEGALKAFVRALLERRDGNLFLPDLEANVRVFAWYGALNGITMAALKGLSPGVPDVYQGHELIELSLVDPDNRRPVDFERRRGLLAQVQALATHTPRGPALRDWLAQAIDGRAKLWALWCALALRRSHEALLRDGDYLPLEVQGPRARHVVAFARRREGQWLVAVVTRLHASLGLEVGALPLGDLWADTVVALPGTLPALADVISGRTHDAQAGTLVVSELLADFPVAALVSG